MLVFLYLAILRRLEIGVYAASDDLWPIWHIYSDNSTQATDINSCALQNPLTSCFGLFDHRLLLSSLSGHTDSR
jgi:hypothetical protein